MAGRTPNLILMIDRRILYDSVLKLGWRWETGRSNKTLGFLWGWSPVLIKVSISVLTPGPDLFLNCLALETTTQLFAGETALDGDRAGQMVMIHISWDSGFLPSTADSLTAPVFHVKQNFSWHKPQKGGHPCPEWNSPSMSHVEVSSSPFYRRN